MFSKVGSLLRRQTTSGKYLPEIDSFRFLAISMTIAFHMIERVHPAVLYDYTTVASRLNRGVPLFFVISGFVLALPFATNRLLGGRPVSLKSYMLRRLTRLEPPYILTLVLCFILLVVLKHQPAVPLLAHLLASAFYMHSAIYNQISSINAVTWSLEIEIQFYLLVPLLCLVFLIRNPWLRRSVVLLGMAASACASELLPHVFFIHHSIVGFGKFFLAGFLLADLYLTHGRPKLTYWWDLATVACLALILYSGPLFWATLMPVGIVVLYWAGFAGRISNAVFRAPVLATIGGMCYSYYLLHEQIIAGAGTAFHSTLAIVISSLIAIAVICTAYFLLIEKPCMDPEWPAKLRAATLRFFHGAGRSSRPSGVDSSRLIRAEAKYVRAEQPETSDVAS
jgi:peptidoglycan/LPS O-acetylase OafA/YrhL